MKRLFLISTALLAATTATGAERDMMCRGPLYGTNGIYNIGTCYIHDDPLAYAVHRPVRSVTLFGAVERSHVQRLLVL
jgi:hypothetical protein